MKKDIHMSKRARRVLGVGVYLFLILLPLILMLALPGPEKRGFWRELSVALGFVGLAMAGLQFLPTARLAFFADVFDLDRVYVVHHRLSMLSVLLVLLHPVILLAQNPYTLYLLNPVRAPWQAQAGLIGLAALLLIGTTSVLRRQLRLGYKLWHTLHLVFSLAIVSFALIHLFEVDYYLAAPGMAAAWIVEAAIWGAGILYVRVLKPWAVKRRPYTVEKTERETEDIWSVYLRPDGHEGLDFAAAQVAWLNIDTSPFALHSNPFSVSSAAHQRLLRFSIQVVGDFTSKVPKLDRSSTVYVDGPYGRFSLEEATADEGFALIAGGIGVAPVMSILHTLAESSDPRPVYLFYGNYACEDIAFAAEIEELADRLKLHVTHALVEPPEGFSGVRGFITAEVLDRELPANRERLRFFICGPLGMIKAMKANLHSLGIPEHQAVIEEYEMA
ncbi:MAG: ferric reductase-like transmembrane domain-containing protein [Spirochaetales bacterium]|nr:ferric reductase-like transmembrane domain-containing protein [Spirochaetales bacterium]